MKSSGTGVVEVPLPAGDQSGVVTAVKGFEHLPVEQSFTIHNGFATATLRLEQWSSYAITAGCLPRNTCTTIDWRPLTTQTG